MDIDQSCSLCSGQATLVCICSTVRLCKRCAVQHITQSERVHTLLPVQAELSILSGDDHHSVVRRSQLSVSYKDFLKAEIEALESFKQSSLSSLDSSSSTLTSALSVLITDKLEAISRDLESAKQAATTFMSTLAEDYLDIEKFDTTVLVKNIVKSNTDLQKLECFTKIYEEVEYEQKITSLTSYEVKCPTDLMVELSREPDEHAEWLKEVRRKKEEELKKQEKCFQRLSGFSSWGVSGPPTLDAISFKVSCPIWVTGLGLGNSNSSGGSAKVQDIEIRQGRSTRGESLYRHPEQMDFTWDGSDDAKFMKVPFTEPIKLSAGVDYCIRVCYSAGSSIHSATGTQMNSCEGVTFTIGPAAFDGGDRDNGSSASSGPIRDIYFALAIAES
jgi:hypothetical protein